MATLRARFRRAQDGVELFDLTLEIVEERPDRDGASSRATTSCRRQSSIAPTHAESALPLSACAASASNRSVTPDIAETTMTGGVSERWSAVPAIEMIRRIASASATEVPPNFITSGGMRRFLESRSTERTEETEEQRRNGGNGDATEFHPGRWDANHGFSVRLRFLRYSAISVPSLPSVNVKHPPVVSPTPRSSPP